MSKAKPIIVLYQESCAFCQWCKQSIVRFSPEGTCTFVGIETTAGQRLINEQALTITVDHPTSIAVLRSGHAPQYKWRATVTILWRLYWFFWPVALIGWLVPSIVGDRVYDVIAKHRRQLCQWVRC